MSFSEKSLADHIALAAAQVDSAERHLHFTVRHAHRNDLDIAKIARAAGVSRTTIYQWLKESES